MIIPTPGDLTFSSICSANFGTQQALCLGHLTPRSPRCLYLNVAAIDICCVVFQAFSIVSVQVIC